MPEVKPNEAPRPPVERPRVAQPTERRFSYVDLASMFRVSVRQVMRWASEGRMPPPVRAGSRTLFTPEHVAAIEAGLKPAGTFPPVELPAPRSRAVTTDGADDKRDRKGGGGGGKKEGQRTNGTSKKRAAQKRPSKKGGRQ